jgi:hypothetical protein
MTVSQNQNDIEGAKNANHCGIKEWLSATQLSLRIYLSIDDRLVLATAFDK